MSDPPSLSDTAILETARALLDLEVPPECLPGVSANLALLSEHARLVGDLDD
jgi:hypothetical protein